MRVNNGVLERKSNESGNGQTWKAFGYGNPSEYKLFATNANETQAARIVAHVVRTLGVRCNVNGFGAAWANATVVEETVNKATKRKLTAAPSIRLGRPQRDKNRNLEREKVAKIDMGTQMEHKLFNAKHGFMPCGCKVCMPDASWNNRIVFFASRLTIEPSNLRITG